MDSFEKRFKAMEVQLKMRPQAASESDETEEDDADLIGRSKRPCRSYDPFYRGVHIADE
jgi:hypothetical protein